MSRFPALFRYYDSFLNPSQTAELVWYWQTGKWLQNDAIFFASLKSNANDGGYFSTENNKARDTLIELSFSHKNMSQLKLIENIKSVIIWNTRHLKLIVLTLFVNQHLDRIVLLASLSLTLYTPASVCIFSILVFRYFQRYWQGEFV